MLEICSKGHDRIAFATSEVGSCPICPVLLELDRELDSLRRRVESLEDERTEKAASMKPALAGGA